MKELSQQQQAQIEAQAYAEKMYQGDGVTGFAIESRNGENVLVVYVDKKIDVSQCVNRVHSSIQTAAGPVIKTVVEEVGQGGFHKMDAPYQSLAAPGYDKIYNKIVGGLQIAPTGAGWVGTLGGIFMATIDSNTIYGALTNAHVAGLYVSLGTKMMQPDDSYRRGAFSKIAWVSPFSKTNDNLVDAAILDCRIDEGHWEGQERWTVHPEQYSGFKLSLRWKDPVVGMEVVKWGRTTGKVRGTCTAVNATDYVNYGNDGTFGFIKQAHFRGYSESLSGPGDSGSFIIEEETGDVVAHLFAGGGDVTIGYPIRHLMEMVNGRLAENPPN